MKEGQVGDGVLEFLADQDGVRKLVECPRCHEFPVPPIQSCDSGHIVCNPCRAATTSCPACKKGYCSVRNFVAEGLLELCIFSCRYAESGCKVWSKLEEMEAHVKACTHRPFMKREYGAVLTLAIFFIGAAVIFSQVVPVPLLFALMLLVVLSVVEK